MAVRGKVKSIRDMGGSYTGLVTDTAAKLDYNYSQPCGKELGLVVDKIVKMEIVNLKDGTQLAVSLDPVEKGKIQTIDVANNCGTLTDNVGNVINFVQDYIAELGLTVGDKVSFAMVMSGGAMLATAVQKPIV